MAFIFSKIGIVIYERVGVLERENAVFPMNCVLSFTQIRCKFRRIHVEDPLTPKIFSLSQIDELVRGVSVAPAHRA